MAKKKATQKLTPTKSSTKRTADRPASTKMPTKPSKKASSRPPVSVAPSGETFPIICSECYGEYDLNSGADMEVITCPVCGHGCKMPESDFFARFSMVRSQQKKHAMFGVLLSIIIVGAFSAWMWLLMHPALAMKTSLVKDDLKFTNLNYAFGGVMFLAAVILIVEIIKYEKSIHHGYF